MKKFLKKHGFNICMILICLVGVGIIAYPTVSEYWNRKVQSRAIREYQDVVNHASKEELERIKVAARLYNQALFDSQQQGIPVGDNVASYEDVLNVSGNGIMGYIIVPSVQMELPIYHGIEEDVLQIAVGHAPTSSVPIGGMDTHVILLGHRGLPSARLFNDLDQLSVDDYFELHVLDEVLYYQIYEIQIVEPQELNNLRISAGRDDVTLVTCTPYGVNTHRLLLCGQRVDGIPDEALVYADARKIDKVSEAVLLGAVLWLLVMIVLIVVSTRHRHRTISRKEQQRRRQIVRKYQKQEGEERDDP